MNIGNTASARPDPGPERLVRAILRQLSDLDRRVDFLEKALLPDLPAPTAADLAGAKAARSAAFWIEEEIASIGSSLDSVIASLDTPRAPIPPPTPPIEPRPVEQEPVVIDLEKGRRLRPRSDQNRPSGWQPAPPRKRTESG